MKWQISHHPRVWLEKRADQVWRKILRKTRRKPKAKSCVLAFIDAVEMKKLNKQFRGKNYPTDVLSFAPVEPGSLGELVFCTDVLKRQAREHQLTYRDELTYMLIHGLLHLLGYDHERSQAEARKMFKIQDAIFEELRSRP